MKVTEIAESKFDNLIENTQKMLRYGGEIMSCLSDLERENGMGERTPMYHTNYGMRGGNMNYRYPMPEHDMYERGNYEYEDEPMMERRGRDSRGRYTSR